MLKNKSMCKIVFSIMLFAIGIATVSNAQATTTNTSSIVLTREEEIVKNYIKFSIDPLNNKIPIEFKKVEKEIIAYNKEITKYNNLLNESYIYVLNIESSPLENKTGAKKVVSQLEKNIKNINTQRIVVLKSEELLFKKLEQNIKDERIIKAFSAYYLDGEERFYDTLVIYASNLQEFNYNARNFYQKLSKIDTKFQSLNHRLIFEHSENDVLYLNYLNDSRRIHKALVSNSLTLNEVLSKNRNVTEKFLTKEELDKIDEGTKVLKEIQDELNLKTPKLNTINQSQINDELTRRLENNPELNIKRDRVRTLVGDFAYSNSEINFQTDIEKSKYELSDRLKKLHTASKLAYEVESMEYKIVVNYEKETPKIYKYLQFYLFAGDGDIEEVNYLFDKSNFYMSSFNYYYDFYFLIMQNLGNVFPSAGTKGIYYIFSNQEAAKKYDLIEKRIREKHKYFFKKEDEEMVKKYSGK